MLQERAGLELGEGRRIPRLRVPTVEIAAAKGVSALVIERYDGGEAGFDQVSSHLKMQTHRGPSAYTRSSSTVKGWPAVSSSARR